MKSKMMETPRDIWRIFCPSSDGVTVPSSVVPPLDKAAWKVAIKSLSASTETYKPPALTRNEDCDHTESEQGAIELRRAKQESLRGEFCSTGED